MPGPLRPSQLNNVLDMIPEAVRTAVASEMLAQATSERQSTDRCRQELDSLRSEFTSQMEGLRSDVKELTGAVGTLSTNYQLIDQRLDFNDQKEQERLRKGTERTPLSNRRNAPSDRYRPDTLPTPSSLPYTPTPPKTGPDPLIKISPRIWQAIFLAAATGAGGTLWHFTENYLWPRAEAPVVHEQHHESVPEPTPYYREVIVPAPGIDTTIKPLMLNDRPTDRSVSTTGEAPPVVH